MISYIMMGLLIVLDVIILAILVKEDTSFRKLQKVVDFKKLQLNERAIDLQMENTQGYINSLVEQPHPGNVESAPDDKEKEERVPVGFKQGKTE